MDGSKLTGTAPHGGQVCLVPVSSVGCRCSEVLEKERARMSAGVESQT